VTRARTALAAAAVCVAAACTPHPQTGVTPERLHDAEQAAHRAIANEKSIDASAFPPQSVGVVPFGVQVADTTLSSLGYGLADLLMNDLARSHELIVVDRLNVDAVLRELRLAASGRVDPATAPRVGRLVAARRLVVGRVAQAAGQGITVDTRVANVATSEVSGAESEQSSLDRILDAEKSLAFRVFDALGVSLTPAERAAVEAKPTKSVAAFLAYSRGVRFETDGQYYAAAAQYEHAVTLDPTFQLAQQRLDDMRRIINGANALLRAASAANDGLNPGFALPGSDSRIGGAADPSFPALTSIIIIVTNPP